MADARKQQEVAAARIRELPVEKVRCRFCGEQSAPGSFKGFAHRWGPTRHRFIAAKP